MFDSSAGKACTTTLQISQGLPNSLYEPTSRYTGGSRVEQLENLLLFGSVEECVQKIDALREAAIFKNRLRFLERK